MRNIFLFIWRNNYYFLFVSLEIIAFWIILQNNFFQKSFFLNSSKFFFGTILSTSNAIIHYFSLKKVNEELAKENAYLKSLHKSSFIFSTNSSVVINDTIFTRNFSYVPAKVVNNSFNRINNYITINKGRRHGIKPGMGVVSPMGVAGIVKDVSDNFATVFSLLHSKIKISGKLKNTFIVGSVVWDSKHFRYANFLDIAKYHHIKIGDTIVTSGFSKIFPENIPIGYITNYSFDKTTDFYNIKLKLATDFSNIGHLYVIINYNQEQELLEAKLDE